MRIEAARVLPLLVLLGALTSLVACGSGQPASRVEIDGSSTVFPVSEAAAEEFRKVDPSVQVNVGVSGTGGGFKRFVAGETDINDASRRIKDSEAAQARENGIDFIEIPIALDGLSVVVNPQNGFVDCLTVDELKRLWEPGSTIQRWSQLRPSFSSQNIRLYGPDSDSGTFDYFTEAIVGEARASRSDYTASADDNVLVQGILGDTNALGYFGYAYYIENADRMKIVAVDNGSGCVEPNAETVASGAYTPLSRSLFLYVSKQSLQREEVRRFLEFYLSNAVELVKEVQYLPLPAGDYQASIDLVREAAG